MRHGRPAWMLEVSILQEHKIYWRVAPKDGRQRQTLGATIPYIQKLYADV
jgi:hypothetical protein